MLLSRLKAAIPLILGGGQLLSCANSSGQVADEGRTERVERLISMTRSGIDGVEYEADLLKWREENEARLKSPTGWLALTGHYWLEEGENSFGPSKEDSIQIPAEVAVQGRFTVHGGIVSIEALQGKLMIDGELETRKTLKIDPIKIEADGENRIAIGDRIAMQLVRRNGRLAVRVRDSESRVLKDFAGKRWYPADPKFVVEAVYTRHQESQLIEIENIRGDRLPSEFSGKLRFEWMGKTYELDAQEEGERELFVVFSDRTAGKSTYKACRFLTLAVEEAGRVQLDFNKAYNPPCAFSPHTLCPLPTPSNALDFEVTAGELAYTASKTP